MPKIDYTGTEVFFFLNSFNSKSFQNYYYDDRSPLESQFSRELFGGAQNVTFWNEVTIRRDEKLNNGSLAFATVLKSARVEYEL